MQPVIPSYVAPIVLTMVVVLAYWLSRLVHRATAAAELDPTTRRRVRLGAGLFLGGWLLLALLLARSTPATDAAGNGVVPLSFPLFVGGSLIVAIGLLAFSPTWRRVVDAVPAESLISVQIYRLIGAIFLPLYASAACPAISRCRPPMATSRSDWRRRSSRWQSVSRFEALGLSL